MVFWRSLGVAGLCIAAASQPGATPGQQAPVFRSGVDLVTVDVAVLDSKGRHVHGLQAEHFEVSVDGTPRRVLWSEFVPQGKAAAELAPAGFAEHFSSNEAVVPGRLIIVAVDQMHIRRVEGRAALRAASNFIDALDATDLVAAAPLNHGGAIEFTRDHAAVKRYLQGLSGEGSFMPTHFNVGLSEALAISDGSRTLLDQAVRRECGESLGRSQNLRRMSENEGVRDPCPEQVEQESRALAQMARIEGRQSVSALGRMIAQLAEIEGPKTLVLLSEGLVAEPQQIDLTALGAAAHAARVTIYVLHLDRPIVDAAIDTISPTMMPDMQLRTDGLHRLSGSARGALFTLVGSDPHPFRRILNEISGYYLVAFEASDADRDGRLHRIAVKTTVDGAIVRARPAFTIPTRLTPAATGSQLERLLRSPRLSTELPLRLGVYTFDGNGASADRLKILVSAETNHDGPGRGVTMGFVVIDDRGVIVASGAGATDSGRYSLPVLVPPGRYTVRAAGIDSGGRQGSVERRVNARLGAAGDVRLSDLMIAEPALQPSAPLRPAVARASGDRIVIYFEAYASPEWTPSGSQVSIELAGTGANGPALSTPVSLRPASPGRWVASAELQLRDMSPGAYMAAARITIPGATPQRLTRSFVVTK